MRYRVLIVTCMLASVLTWAGCSSEEKPGPTAPKPPANVAPTPTPAPPGSDGDGDPAPAPMSRPVSTPSAEELMAQWQEIAQGDAESMDVAGAIGLAQQMVAHGPDGLKPLLDVLANPEADAEAKMLAAMSLTPVVNEEMAARLIALSQADQEETTRASAAHLLGVLQTEESQARAAELTEDDSARVRGAAIISLAMRGDEGALGKLRALWNDPEATKEQREQIVFVLPPRLSSEHVDLLAEALGNTEMRPAYRQKAAGMLGRTAKPEALEALRKAAENDPNDQIQELAAAAAEAVAARIESVQGKEGEETAE